jgi:hypothetical protein
MTSKQSSLRLEVAKAIHNNGLKTTVFSVLSISLELLAALAVFFTSQSTLPTLVAILLAILASVQSVWWWVSDSSAWLKVWLEGEPLTFDDEEEPDLFDKLPRQAYLC